MLAVVAAVCAALSQFIVGYSRGGCPVSFGTAFIGAYAGPRLAAEWGIPTVYVLTLGTVSLAVVQAAAGSFLLALAVNFLLRKRKF